MENPILLHFNELFYFFNEFKHTALNWIGWYVRQLLQIQ